MADEGRDFEVAKAAFVLILRRNSNLIGAIAGHRP
jgi:hypothetical protein